VSTAVAFPPQAPRTSAPAMPGALAPTPGASQRLPALHFAAALLFLVLGAAGLVWVAPELARGTYLSPRVAGVTHLFTLGWLTTTIFGALYQLLPVALGAPIRSERLGHVSGATFVPGVALFATGIATGSLALHHAGIALVATGIVLLVANVALSLRRASVRDVTWAAVAIAIAFLASTLVLGVVLLHNIHTGFLAEHRLRVLAIHLHVALVGWGLTMLVGMSHRLLPMFLLAHGADTRWTRRSLLLLTPGVVLLAAGLARQQRLGAWVGLALLEAGVICFLVQARCFYRARRRPALDVGLRFAAVALGFLAVSAALGPALLALGGIRHPRLATAYVLVGLLGGVLLFVVGHFYKIVPFLAWIARFGRRVGRERVPTVAELYSARVAHAQLLIMTAAVAGLAAGVALGSPLVARASALLFCAGVALFVSQIVRMVRGRRS
jgi:hypothetical protein